MLSRFIAALVAMAIVNLASSLAFAASISLSVQAGPPDTKTIVKGTGLGANAIHEVYFGLQQLTFGVTDGAGKLTLELNIPETALPGNQVISIIPHSGNGASAQKFFEVRTNWTQWHHDAASTGRVAFDNVLKTTTVKNLGLSWRLPGGSVQSAPLLVDKAVYYITSDGHLRAVNRNTRAPVFNIVAGALPLTAPTYGGGKVVVAAAGKIKAFSSKTGALAWKANLPPGVGTPVVSDGIVYVVAEGNTNAGVFAFKVDCGTGGATCTPVWHALLGSTSSVPPIESSVAVGGGNVYAVAGGKLYGLKVGCNTGGATCTPYADWGSIRNWAPAFSNNYVFAVVGAAPVELAAFLANGPSLSPAWKGQFDNFSKNGTVTVAGNQAFVLGGGMLSAFPASCSAPTCVPNWETPLLGGSYATAVAGDIVYALTEDHVYAFPASCSNNCRPLWQAGTGGLPFFAPYISLAVADGNVYVPGNQGINVFNLNNLSGQAFLVDKARLKPSPQFAAAESRLDIRLSAARR